LFQVLFELVALHANILHILYMVSSSNSAESSPLFSDYMALARRSHYFEGYWGQNFCRDTPWRVPTTVKTELQKGERFLTIVRFLKKLEVFVIFL
jgi:hypothetical protein